MEKEYRSVFCFCGGYERPAPVSPGALAERDHTSLAECGDEASLARSKSRNGRVVHSNCRASSSGTYIQLLVDVPAGEVRARAAVRRSKHREGMGVKFVAMQQEDRARFAGWLKHLSV